MVAAANVVHGVLDEPLVDDHDTFALAVCTSSASDEDIDGGDIDSVLLKKIQDYTLSEGQLVVCRRILQKLRRIMEHTQEDPGRHPF